jgi:hypothetical protein
LGGKKDGVEESDSMDIGPYVPSRKVRCLGLGDKMGEDRSKTVRKDAGKDLVVRIQKSNGAVVFGSEGRTTFVEESNNTMVESGKKICGSKKIVKERREEGRNLIRERLIEFMGKGVETRTFATCQRGDHC